MKPEIVKKILEQTRNNYDQLAEDWNRTRQKIWPNMNDFLPDVKDGDKILDAGCGNGRLVKLFENIKIDYAGLDISAKLIALAKNNFPGINFLPGDILNLPFAGNHFDAVFCLAALHHLPGAKMRNQAMGEFYRVLRPGGRVFLMNWHFTSPKLGRLAFRYTLAKIFEKSELDFGDIYLGWGKTGINRYVHLFTAREMKKLLAAAGFKEIKNYLSLPSPRDFRNLVSIAKKC